MSAKANLVAGPVLAVADRARNLIRDAMKNRDKPPDPREEGMLDLDPDLDSTLDRRTDLAELRDGGPTDTPGAMTTTGGSAGPASIPRRARPDAAPTTTGDAGSGGMHAPIGGATSDNTTGGNQG